MRRLLVISLAMIAVAAGCESEANIKANDIVDVIPWTAPESSTYRVLDDDDEEVGTLVLSVEEEGADAFRFTQEFDFPEREFTNDAEVIATADELQPRSAHFRIEGPDGVLDCTATYEESSVKVHRVGEDGERDDEESVPSISYDSWADLFTWRTIAFAEGYETEYADILSCTLDRTQKLGVRLEVKEQEEVTVPAGTYQAWRLEIDSGGETQKAWYTADDARLLVKYDNGSEVFELTEE